MPTGFDIAAFASVLSHPRVVLYATNKAFLASQSLGGAEGRRIVDLEALIGPSPRMLLKLHTDPDNAILARFRGEAQAATMNLSTLNAVLSGGMVPNEDQSECFQHFFFVSARSTSDLLSLPHRILTHQVGTQWLLRILNEAIYSKMLGCEDNLLASASSNSCVWRFIRANCALPDERRP